MLGSRKSINPSAQRFKDALDQFAKEICLIESDREREKDRLTYQEFKERAQPLARALQDSNFRAADRAAIIMTNQSKWLISAYVIFFCGGVLVPLDYKLTSDEQWQLLRLIPARAAALHGVSCLAAARGSAGRCSQQRHESKNVVYVIRSRPPAPISTVRTAGKKRRRKRIAPVFALVPRTRRAIFATHRLFVWEFGGRPEGAA